MKNWPKVSSKEKIAEVKGERERDSLNSLKSNYKNRKTNYTKIEKWAKTSPKLAKKWQLELRSSIGVNSEVLRVKTT